MAVHRWVTGKRGGKCLLIPQGGLEEECLRLWAGRLRPAAPNQSGKLMQISTPLQLQGLWGVSPHLDQSLLQWGRRVKGEAKGWMLVNEA